LILRDDKYAGKFPEYLQCNILTTNFSTKIKIV